jgi:hypothetical protein
MIYEPDPPRPLWYEDLPLKPHYRNDFRTEVEDARRRLVRRRR